MKRHFFFKLVDCLQVIGWLGNYRYAACDSLQSSAYLASDGARLRLDECFLLNNGKDNRETRGRTHSLG